MSAEAQPPPRVVLFITSITSTARLRAHINQLRTLLELKRVAFEEVDLARHPQRRTDMLAGSGGVTALPQLHIDGKFVGDADTVQELEDAQELQGLLDGATSRPDQAAAQQDEH